MDSRRCAAAAAALLAMVAVGGCVDAGSVPSADHSASVRLTSSEVGPQWILSAGAVPKLVQAGLPRAQLEQEFDRPTTLLLARRVWRNKYLPQSSTAFSFPSADALVAALDTGQVPDSTRWLLLDLERWTRTPQAEQQDPIGALRRAVAAAHAHGKQVLFTPGVDLMGTLRPGLSGVARYGAFIESVVSPGAAVADAFEVQSQSTEATGAATTFVGAAVAAARSAHPGAPVLAGLSTNPNGRRVQPGDLVAVYRAARSAGATGFWLNVPNGGTACPNCGAAQPQVAVAFLQAITNG
ncbi:hypothetical protein G4X40_06975 [Rhodococcus sp. D2-41]|uniref:hypothetical protein n=1 Tax=Speluncibacter jeojiensis TaxID=2710754 RepID=UPI00240F65E4|nr:hypothetical protein [Rhodococcus sp. D2-41]MDG3009888.1 hypothetical protein [Rhodococcus sp. D2-41]